MELNYLYKEIMEATERRMTKTEAAHLFGANLSPVKRHARSTTEGKLLVLERPGSRPKTNQSVRRLIEDELKRRFAGLLGERCEYLSVTFGR